MQTIKKIGLALKKLILFSCVFLSVTVTTFVIADTLTDGQLWKQVFNKTDAGDSNLKDHTRRARHFLSEKFGISEAGGYRSGDDDGQGTGHGAGLAVDYMVGPYGSDNDPEGKGKKLADFASKNMEALQISYIIWDQKFYMAMDNIYGPANTWNLMPDRGSNTQNHKDHVHISFTQDGEGKSKIDASFAGDSYIEGQSGEYVASPSTESIHDELPPVWELVGMTKREYLYETQNKIEEAPELSDSYKKNLASIREGIDGEKVSWMYWLRVAITFIGILWVIYGVLLILAYIFDRTNSFFDISVLSILTVGRYSYSHDSSIKEAGGVKYLTITGVLKLALFCQVIAYLLYSGTVYSILEFIVTFVSSLANNG